MPDLPDMSKLLDFDTTAIQSFSVSLVGVILLLIVGYFVARILRSFTHKSLKRAKLDETLAVFLSKGIFWLIFLFIILACLSIFGVETTSVAAVVGAAGLAIGLAFQGTLSNFAAGVMIAFFRTFKIGNVITVDGQTGGVTEIDLFTTTLNTPDNRVIIIPNSKIFGATLEIGNAKSTRRVDVSVGTCYGADIEETRKALEEAAKVEGVIEDPASAIIMADLGASSIQWSIRVWCKTEDFWAVRERIVVNIKKQLDLAKIDIPFPQIVITNKN